MKTEHDPPDFPPGITVGAAVALACLVGACTVLIVVSVVRCFGTP